MDFKKGLIFSVAILLLMVTAESLNFVFFMALSVIAWLAANSSDRELPNDAPHKQTGND